MLKNRKLGLNTHYKTAENNLVHKNKCLQKQLSYGTLLNVLIN